jgi:pyruvate kinase
VGSQILIADGSLVCEVLELKEKSVMVKVLNNCCLGERKNMNLPGCIVDLPTVTEKDAQDI